MLSTLFVNYESVYITYVQRVYIHDEFLVSNICDVYIILLFSWHFNNHYYIRMYTKYFLFYPYRVVKSLRDLGNMYIPPIHIARKLSITNVFWIIYIKFSLILLVSRIVKLYPSVFGTIDLIHCIHSLYYSFFISFPIIRCKRLLNFLILI